ncbi:MAG: universal stress protein [Chthoniobacterales bacterium]
MTTIGTSRPRNVDWPRAAAILYGDWGTSKAYVLGLAFAVAGYSSFWLILPMCLLTGLVGINYMTICRLYPNGGGVYASVRHRSEVISIVGAFLLIADYLVTAALSALSAFQYLGTPHPAYCAGGVILIIGFLNIFGPRKTGSLALLISVPTALVVMMLALFSLPHLGAAWSHLQPLHGNLHQNWIGFVGIVLALSGVEAVANSTGIMKLDPGSSLAAPSVKKTSTRAISLVLLEVVIFTSFLGIAMLALPGLTVVHGDVNAPGAEGVRDYMLRYMGEIFVGSALGPTCGIIAGWAVSITFGLLLLSAVNTAILDLIAISFLMAQDKELPPLFAKLNPFGVPHIALLMMTLLPAALVVFVGDVAALADLYAVGVVGAIATNLGATASDSKLSISRRERLLMLVTFGVLFSIEVTLFIEKPQARLFAITILAVGLILRSLAKEYAARKATEISGLDQTTHFKSNDAFVPIMQHSFGDAQMSHELQKKIKDHVRPILAAVRRKGRTLDFAVREAREAGHPLYVLFVRQQPVITAEDQKRKWQEDPKARVIFESLKDQGLGETIFPCYAVSDSPQDTIIDIASTIGAERLIIGAPQRGTFIKMLRGDVIKNLSKNIPEDIDLIVCG